MIINVDIMEIVLSLSSIIDLACPQLNEHHARVAHIARNIAETAGLDGKACENIYVAALLHDCGALSLKDKIKALDFDARLEQGHSEVGYKLLKPLKYFDEAAGIIRHHHVWWNKPKAGSNAPGDIPEESYILHLADRVDVLTKRNVDILEQADGIRAKIAKESARMFKPELTDIFLKLSEKDAFWTGIGQASGKSLPEGSQYKLAMGKQDLLEIVNAFDRIIDFRSRFTATHSRGVAIVSQELARCMDMDEDEVFMLRLAGAFHDIGKIGVPLELLEKKGRLTEEEYEDVRRHAMLSYEVLSKIKCLEPIKEYAAYHHERLDGTGYPFGLRAEDLSTGARIVAVSDMFTAMTEDRPYRKGMETEETLKILKTLAEKGKLDECIVGVLEKRLDKFKEIQYNEQNTATKEYKQFLKVAYAS